MPRRYNNYYINSGNQLCWYCAKACGGSNCPWANKLQPVPGWKAEHVYRERAVEITSRGKKRVRRFDYESYSISECPLFESDGKLVYKKV